MPEGITTALGTAKVWVFVGSAIGAVFGIAASPPMPKKMAFFYVSTGCFVGGSVARLLGWYFDIPLEVTVYLGALMGIPGIGLSVAIIRLLKDPISTMNRIRGVKDE
jgi:hypothetical protein